MTLGLRREEGSDRIDTVLRIATVREFRSFRYEIQVQDRFDAAARTIQLRVQGVQAPTNLMPSAGAAVRELSYPDLAGEYIVEIAGAKQSTCFRFSVEDETIALMEPPEEGTLGVIIEKGVAIVRG